jgi:hypothetical protein
VKGAGKLWLRFAAAGGFVLAVVGYPVTALAIAGLLALLLKLEARS